VGADCRHSKRRPQEIVTAANQVPGLVGVFSLFNTRTPKVYADIDRVRAEMLGVTANRVFETLQVYLGSSDGRLSQQAAGCRFVDPVAMHELLHDRLGKELIEPRLVQCA
jgi:multidrug efflux pump subunit AcrB